MTKKKRGIKHPLLLGMTIYAVVFLIAAGVGLFIFWNFIASYEASRPDNTIEDYVSQLTVEDIVDTVDDDLIMQVDTNLQTEEECRKVIMDSLTGEITYAKKTSESTDTRMVYAIRCGSKLVGSVTLNSVEVDKFGFARWEIGEAEFEMSLPLEDCVTVTVPEGFGVLVNGKMLDQSYITVRDIRYDALEDFYDDYQLPTMVTYEAGPFLGTVTLETVDTDGIPVEIDEAADYISFLDNCNESDRARLTKFSDAFLARYVAFTGSAHKSSENNFAKLLPYVVLGSDLHQRMSMALDGLSWAQSNGDTLVSITYHCFTSIGEGKYICDATYEVDTSGREGIVRTTSNVRFVIVELPGELRVEMLTSY